MLKCWATLSLAVLCLLGGTTATQGQQRGRMFVEPDSGPIDRGDIPTWPVDAQYPQDLFTFARIKYTSSGRERTSFAWWTDFADADLNLSYRLQQLTSWKVNPEPVRVTIGDPRLFDYPWTFMSGVGNIVLTDKEAATLRRYMLRGGFVMVDDFWGQAEWDGFYHALKKIFPEREPVDLPRSHPIFHCVYDIPNDRPLQTPNIRAAIASRETGVTWEDGHAGGNTREPHYRAVFDDKGRMMMFICHNTDNGDGWEEEGADAWFFSTFSANRNYPLAVNIVFYAMTH